MIDFILTPVIMIFVFYGAAFFLMYKYLAEKVDDLCDEQKINTENNFQRNKKILTDMHESMQRMFHERDQSMSSCMHTKFKALEDRINALENKDNDVKPKRNGKSAEKGESNEL